MQRVLPLGSRFSAPRVSPKKKMAWPWGGSVTHHQLAAKFGWPAVAISLLLLPVTFLWRHLIACNFLLSLLPHGVFNSVTIYRYPKSDDLVRRELYTGPTNVVGRPTGFVAHADTAGGKWFESFWGVLHVLDLEASATKWEITSNPMSFFPVYVAIDFPQPPVHYNKVTFHFPFKGPLLLNPLLFLTLTPVGTSIANFAFLPGKQWLTERGASVENIVWPSQVDAEMKKEL